MEIRKLNVCTMIRFQALFSLHDLTSRNKPLLYGENVKDTERDRTLFSGRFQRPRVATDGLGLKLGAGNLVQVLFVGGRNPVT